jgi:hypothetical protein
MDSGKLKHGVFKTMLMQSNQASDSFSTASILDANRYTQNKPLAAFISSGLLREISWETVYYQVCSQQWRQLSQVCREPRLDTHKP